VISVKDTGIGIPPEAQGKIFDRFRQATDDSARQYEGSGLGLSIVKEILAMHNAKIYLTSTPGIGSSFYFKLPLA